MRFLFNSAVNHQESLKGGGPESHGHRPFHHGRGVPNAPIGAFEKVSSHDMLWIVRIVRQHIATADILQLSRSIFIKKEQIQNIQKGFLRILFVF